MVVRLAEKQGLLSQRKLTSFQMFALTYFVVMDRRQKRLDEQSFIQQLTAVMDPVRFRQVYLHEQDHFDPFEEVPGYEIQPEDFEDIDKYLASLDKTRTGQA